MEPSIKISEEETKKAQKELVAEIYRQVRKLYSR